MGEGHPVTVEFMNELVRNYSETYSGTPHGRLPSNLLYADTRKGSERYVWYNPPGKRMMYFVGGLGIEESSMKPVAHGWTSTPTRKTDQAWRRRSMRRRFST